MTPSEMPLTLHNCRIHRICRVGACPVLEITVTYPALSSDAEEAEDLPGAVTRFNETYRTMAEKLADWAEGALGERAMADFTGAGPGAAYRFDRRLVVCDMIADLGGGEAGESRELTVTRTLRLTSRRGEVAERRLTAADRWSLPAFTLRPPRRGMGGH